MKLKPLTAVTQAFLCYTMTRPDEKCGALDLDRHHRWQGYSKIAVHVVIRRDGSFEQGRRVTERGALCPGANDRTLQVALEGGLDSDGDPCTRVTTHQYAALCALLTQWKEAGAARLVRSSQFRKDQWADRFEENEQPLPLPSE